MLWIVLTGLFLVTLFAVSAVLVGARADRRAS